jgi:hypothetical protein
MTTDTWHLAICTCCQPVAPEPFTDEAERDTWADAHATATGHDVRRVTEHRRAGTDTMPAGWAYLGEDTGGGLLWIAPPGTPPPGP